MILSAVFPIRPEIVTIDVESGDVIRQEFEPSFHIERAGGCIPRTASMNG